jgi:predicted 3-demethylubiquinone-9 3-methyltransferase (glyoxalase superfamily)
MQKITIHLWFDKEAKEAAEFYISLFQDSKTKNTTELHNTPSGDVDMISIELLGQEFSLINAGPPFKFNPSISFIVSYSNKDEIDLAWKKLLEDGEVLMELGEYPFSEKYGWLKDKWGVSWQLIFDATGEMTQRIIPTLMFVGDNNGKAEEAINFYTSIFHNAHIGDLYRYGEGADPDDEKNIMHATFTLEDLKFATMDSAREHDFTFNEAVSIIVHCKSQEEVDYYWDKLSAVPEAEQCGWLKDKYGVSWQIVPTVMEEMLNTKDEKKLTRVTETFLKMKKLDIAALQQAYLNA